MRVGQFTEALRADLMAVVAVGDERAVRAAERIGAALEPSLTLRLVEALSAAAVELSAQIQNGHVEVRLAGRDPQLVYVEDDEPAAQQPATPDDGATARITLRLSDGLKDEIEGAAAAAGVSVNTWIVRALARAVAEPARRSRGRNRLTGFAES